MLGTVAVAIVFIAMVMSIIVRVLCVAMTFVVMIVSALVMLAAGVWLFSRSWRAMVVKL